MVQVREGGILSGDYEFHHATAITGNGAGSDSICLMGIAPYLSWRVVAVGFYVVANGASGVAEKVNFGVGASDIGAADDDYFGAFTQDNTALKNLVAGDMITNPTHPKLRTPDAPANAGTHVWAAGSPDGIGVWQSKQAILTITKKNVGSSTATVLGWVLVEIGD